MAFTIRKRDTFRWTIEHTMGMRAGEPEIMAFDVDFAALPESKITALMEDVKKGGVSNRDVLKSILRGFHDLKGEDGGEVTYSEASLDQLLEEFPGIFVSIFRAFTVAMTGGAARKN